MNTNKPFPTTEAELRKIVAETVTDALVKFVIGTSIVIGVIEWLIQQSR